VCAKKSDFYVSLDTQVFESASFNVVSSSPYQHEGPGLGFNVGLGHACDDNCR
jgi:hypothetical protein